MACRSLLGFQSCSTNITVSAPKNKQYIIPVHQRVNALYCDNTILRHALYDDMFQRMKSLPFVPVDDIGYAWEVLKLTIPSDMADYTQYYESTWIGTPNSPAKFDPACSNQHDSALAGLPRSSNIAEGWHLGFKSLVQCTNPTLWTFLDALKLEDC